MAHTPLTTDLTAFAKYARPHLRHSNLLGVGLSIIFWPALLITIATFARIIYDEGLRAFMLMNLNVVMVFYWSAIGAVGRLRKRVTVDAQAVLKRETRTPVLYLRSFHYEGLVNSAGGGPRATRLYEKENADEVLALALKDECTLVAVGQPDDKLPPLGSLRLYFTDEEWQGQVERLMSLSRFVLLQPGYTGGTDWEIQRTRELPPEKIIFSFLSWLELDRAARQLQYELFALQLKRAYGCELPKKIGRAFFLCFDQAGRPRLVSLSGWPAVLFGLYSAPSIIWRLFFNFMNLIAEYSPKSVDMIWAELLKRLPVPGLFRPYSVASVREAIRPILRERGIRLPVWRTVVYGLLATVAGVVIVIGLYGLPLVLMLVLVALSLAGDYLKEVDESRSPVSHLRPLSLTGGPVPAAGSEAGEISRRVTEFKKCSRCGLGNWHEASVCERCNARLPPA